MHPIGMCSASLERLFSYLMLSNNKLVLNELSICLGEFNERDFIPKMA